MSKQPKNPRKSKKPNVGDRLSEDDGSPSEDDSIEADTPSDDPGLKHKKRPRTKHPKRDKCKFPENVSLINTATIY